MQKFAIKLLLVLSFILTIFQHSLADTFPKREIRAAWITPINGNWPLTSERGTTSTHIQNQKNHAIAIIEEMKANGFNAIFIHARPYSDRMFLKTSYTHNGTKYTVYEPFSHHVSGTRGTETSYDPLAFWVEECHKRGMECHAWINPLRFCNTSGDVTTPGWPCNSLNVDKEVWNNGWIIYQYQESESNKTTKFCYDPSISEVRSRINNVCAVIAGNYDVDGIVWDDYFYPDGIPENLTAGDYDRYQNYLSNGGTMTMADWRRENCNTMIREAYQSIKSIKPYIKFGLAPAGAGGGNPRYCAFTDKEKSEISVLNGNININVTWSDWQYNTIYADLIAWLREGTIDYISPQLYWSTKHQTNPFDSMCQWWQEVSSYFGRHCYPSNGFSGGYTNGGKVQDDWDEIVTQIKTTREVAITNAPGSIVYPANYFDPQLSDYYNSGLAGKTLSSNVYQKKALVPAITWQNATNPGIPQNLKFSSGKLSWDNATMIDGSVTGIGMRYAVYAIPLSVGINDAKSTIHTNDGGFKADYLLDVTYSNSFDVSSYSSSSYWYAVTIVDRYGNEWEAAKINAPNLGDVSISLSSPAHNSIDVPFSDNTFSWTSDGTSFTIQISESEDFSKPLIEEVVTTTNVTISTANFKDGATYFWRVIASKEYYNSTQSEVRSFTMGTRPTLSLTLLSPENTSTINSETISFSWDGIEGTTYTLELSKSESFENIIFSKTTTNTSYSSRFNLASTTQYYWRVKASHPNYSSVTSETRSFISPHRKSSASNLVIEELWNYSATNGNLPEVFNQIDDLGNSLLRTMTAYNGNIYISYRKDANNLYLLEYSGKTGEYIRQIKLSGDCETGSYGANCVFVDDANHLCVSSMGTSSTNQVVVCTVDLTNGNTTRVFAYGAENLRIDYVSALGDVTNVGGQIWAATAHDSNVSTNNNHIYRWTLRSDGYWDTETTKMTSYLPSNGNNGTAPYVMPISNNQYIVDGGGNYPTLYPFNAGSSTTLISGFESNNELKPRTIAAGGINQVTIGNYPLFIYSSETNEGTGYNFDIVHNPSNYDFSKMEYVGTIPYENLGYVRNRTILNSIATINNDDNSVTVFIYAPLNGLAAYRISLPKIEISLNSPADNEIFEEDVDFSWSGVDGASYTIELSKTESFDEIAFSATTEETSYNSSNFNLDGSTQYYWRVKASHPNYTSATSATRSFISPQKKSAKDNLTIKELWNFSVNKGNRHSQLGAATQRSMTAYNGNVYVITNSSGALLEFDGSTGEYNETINLSGDCFTNSSGSKISIPTNCVFVDGGNNLCVSNLVASSYSTNPLTVCTIDTETGNTTRVFESTVAIRVDYANAYGDITKDGGQIWASTNTNQIYRWTRVNGSWEFESTTIKSFYPTTATSLGTAPWVMPISETQFLVDGGSNYPTLYTFNTGGNATYVSGFDSNTALTPRTIAAGGTGKITLGKYPLFIYNSENHQGAGHNFDIVHNPSSYDFSKMESLWTKIPDGKLGDEKHSTILNSVATIKNEDNSATVFVYAPLNGLAAYRISLPNAPISLVSPINNTPTEEGFDFKWSGISDSKYTIEVSSSESFENIEFTATTEANTYSSANFSLNGSTKYYWRVKVANENYTTTTSAVAQFTSPALPTMTPPLLYKPYDYDYDNTPLSTDISFVAKYSYIIGDNGEKIYTPKTTLEISKTADFSKLYYSGTENWVERSSEASNYETWLQYTLPISIFSNGTYYWRVKAESAVPNLTEGISEVRKFVVEGQSEAPGTAETNYTPMLEDEPEYPLITSGANIYTLTNIWIRNSEKNALKGQNSPETGTNYRDFCARSAQYGDQDGKDILWLAGRNSNYSASAFLDKYDANTGEYLGRLTLTGSYATSMAACNNLFLDDAGRLCMTNIAPANGTLQFATIDPTTGAVTIKQELSVPERIDHARVIGDIENGEAYIFATSSEATVYRWKLKNGKLTSNTYESITLTSFYPATAKKLGTATRIYPIDSEYFYLDGDGSAFTLYQFSSSSPVSTFAAFSSCAPVATNRGSGGTFFTHDSKHFILYSSSAFEKTTDTDFDYLFTLANVSEFTSWDSMNKYWALPRSEKFGTVINSNGAYGMLADYLQYDAITGAPKGNVSTYSSGYDRTNIFTYVPGNGMAAYSLTRHIYTGAEDVEAKNKKIGINNHEITFGCKVDNAQIYTLSGMMINSIDNSSSIELPATKGVYILRLTLNETTTNHKIVI